MDVHRILKHFGRLASYQKVVTVKDRLTGGTTKQESGSPVEAMTAKVPASTQIIERLTMMDEVLVVDGKPFALAGERLSEGWVVTLADGSERTISGEVASLNDPAGAPIMFQTVLSAGGAG